MQVLKYKQEVSNGVPIYCGLAGICTRANSAARVCTMYTRVYINIYIYIHVYIRRLVSLQGSTRRGGLNPLRDIDAAASVDIVGGPIDR